MAATNINRVIITGNLTRDPELRSTGSGLSVCSLRVACNTRRKDQASGEWVDKPNFFDVTVWGAQGENCARFLSKGRPVAIDGRLEWREWQDKEGKDRYTTEIIASEMQMLGGRGGSGGGTAEYSQEYSGGSRSSSGGGSQGDFGGGSKAPAGGSNFDDFDDDIPF